MLTLPVPGLSIEQQSPETLAWLAGIVDGEGCITITRKGRYHQVILSIGNTDMNLLEHAQQIGGGERIHGDGGARARRTNHRWKLFYYVSWSGVRARRCLTAIFPYLRAKRSQALIALGVGATLLPTGKARKLPPGVWHAREFARQQIRFFNRRGYTC